MTSTPDSSPSRPPSLIGKVPEQPGTQIPPEVAVKVGIMVGIVTVIFMVVI